VKRIVINVSVFVCVVILIILIGERSMPTRSVYAVDEVQAGLQHQPQAWARRSVLIHGFIIKQASAMCMPSPSGRIVIGIRTSSFCQRTTWVTLASTPVERLTRPALLQIQRLQVQGLTVLLRPGDQLPRSQPRTPLDTLYDLPFVGPLLRRMLVGKRSPRDDSLTLHIRLTSSQACHRAARAAKVAMPFCPDGTLLTP